MDQTSNQPAGTPSAGASSPHADRLAIFSLVFGVLSLLTGLIFVGALFGLIAIVLGFAAIKRLAKPKTSMLGVILGTMGIVLTILALVFNIKLFDVFKQSDQERSQFKTVREFTKGETGKFGNLNVSATKVTRNYEPSDSAQKAEEGKELVVVSVSVENSSATPVSVEPEDFKLETDDGLAYGPGFATAPNAEFAAGTLASKAKASGELVFKIKSGAKSLKLTQKGYDYNPATKRNEYVTYKLSL